MRMISEKERCGIVEFLRDEADHWRDYNKDDDTLRMSDSDFTESILEAFGFDGTAVPVYEVFDKLADLADRPTCHLDLTDTETHGNAKVRCYECSECGGACEEIYGKYERCPHCGAEVVSGDGD